MTVRRELFTDLDGDVSGSVRFGDASRVDIQGVGTIAFEGKNGERWLLHGVFYIPALKNSIMSLGRLDKDGSEVRIRDGVLRVWDQRGRLMIKVLRSPNFLYTHHFNAAKPRRPDHAEGQKLCLAARKDDQAWLWHERYGHLQFDALHKLCKDDMVRGMPVIKHDGHLCDTCVITKQRRAPFPAQA